MRNTPKALEAEAAVIGAALINRQAQQVALEILRPVDFYNERNAIIFEKIAFLARKKALVELVSIAETLEKSGQLSTVGGTQYLSDLCEHAPAASNISYYAGLVREAAILRGVISTAENISAMAEADHASPDEVLDDAERRLLEIRRGAAMVDDVDHLSVGLADLYADLDARSKMASDLWGVSTGLHDLDSITGGLQPGRMYIIGARPAMGKSALAVSLGVNIARCGAPVLFFSLEMPRDELQKRILAAECRVDLAKFARPKTLTSEEWGRVANGAGAVDEIPLWVDDTAYVTLDYIKRISRRAVTRRGVRCIMIDHLQLIRAGKKFYSRVNELSEMTAELKILSKELGVPVVVLSQLSRGIEERQDKRPQLSDLRESGSIEQDADVCMFIYRDAYYNPESADRSTELIIRKNRSGRVGTVKLLFEPHFCRFVGIPRIEVKNDDF